jgi:hypothetical protein
VVADWYFLRAQVIPVDHPSKEDCRFISASIVAIDGRNTAATDTETPLHRERPTALLL